MQQSRRCPRWRKQVLSDVLHRYYSSTQENRIQSPFCLQSVSVITGQTNNGARSCPIPNLGDNAGQSAQFRSAVADVVKLGFAEGEIVCRYTFQERGLMSLVALFRATTDCLV
jgi:hypothetical protein